MNEIVVKHAINRAGGLPDNYNDIINIISFRSDITGPARMEMERFSNSWLDEFYPEGSDDVWDGVGGAVGSGGSGDGWRAVPAGVPVAEQFFAEREWTVCGVVPDDESAGGDGGAGFGVRGGGGAADGRG